MLYELIPIFKQCNLIEIFKMFRHFIIMTQHLIFTYFPLNCKPLVLLVSEKEKIAVYEIKTIILKSLARSEDTALCEVSVSQLSQRELRNTYKLLVGIFINF